MTIPNPAQTLEAARLELHNEAVKLATRCQQEYFDAVCQTEGAFIDEIRVYVSEKLAPAVVEEMSTILRASNWNIKVHVRKWLQRGVGSFIADHLIIYRYIIVLGSSKNNQ